MGAFDEVDGVEDIFDPINVPPEVEPELADILPRGYLSVSQIKTVLKCPHQWELLYLENVPRGTSARLFQGVAVHKAVETVLSVRLQTGTLPPLALATDTFADTFEADKGKVNDWEGQDEGAVKDLGVNCAKIYMQEAAAAATPVAVEQTFFKIIKTADGKIKLPVLGRIDSVQVQSLNEQDYQNIREKVVAAQPKDVKEGAATALPTASKPLRVHDLKVVTNKWGEGKIKNDLQFLLYAGATGIPDMQVDQLVKGKAKIPRPHYEVLTEVITNKDVQDAVEVIQGVAKTIALGHFPRTDPSNWWCSETWCGVWKYCRGEK